MTISPPVRHFIANQILPDFMRKINRDTQERQGREDRLLVEEHRARSTEDFHRLCAVAGKHFATRVVGGSFKNKICDFEDVEVKTTFKERMGVSDKSYQRAYEP
jgi:hypothetical protein